MASLCSSSWKFVIAIPKLHPTYLIEGIAGVFGGCFCPKLGRCNRGILASMSFVVGLSSSNFPRNRVSGFTTQQLAHKATKAGASGVEGLARAGKSGRHRGNIARDLLRNMLVGCTLPLLYWALIPMRDPKTDQNNVLTWMPFLLVHEMLAALWAFFGEQLYEPSPSVEKNLKASCKANGLDFDKNVVLPLGVHGDGVPNQAHKTIVAFTWNILGKLSERILFAALSKDRGH